MAYCGKCGNQIEEGVKFCPACGAALQVAQPETVQPEPQQPVQPEPTAEEKLQQATQTIDSVAQKLGNTADHSAEYDKTDAEANKVMALLSYFGILVLVPIFASKHSPFVRYHANQGVVLLLAMIGYSIADGIVTAILRAILYKGLGLWSIYSMCSSIINLLYVGFTIFAIIGIINVLNGRAKDLPIIGKYRVLK